MREGRREPFPPAPSRPRRQHAGDPVLTDLHTSKRRSSPAPKRAGKGPDRRVPQSRPRGLGAPGARDRLEGRARDPLVRQGGPVQGAPVVDPQPGVPDRGARAGPRSPRGGRPRADDVRPGPPRGDAPCDDAAVRRRRPDAAGAASIQSSIERESSVVLAGSSATRRCRGRPARSARGVGRAFRRRADREGIPHPAAPGETCARARRAPPFDRQTPEERLTLSTTPRRRRGVLRHLGIRPPECGREGAATAASRSRPWGSTCPR
jgi:hypothetical protein